MAEGTNDWLLTEEKIVDIVKEYSGRWGLHRAITQAQLRKVAERMFGDCEHVKEGIHLGRHRCSSCWAGLRKEAGLE
ncbi:hypothetical protein LCGC14_0985180 [marine sediment metagenome]|uniref:Uncharacterized protein n=1 Tax=marine sediment metagenome TaxID=412755 RepID=A0A0F9NTV9_9ZZZZ